MSKEKVLQQEVVATQESDIESELSPELLNARKLALQETGMIIDALEDVDETPENMDEHPDAEKSAIRKKLEQYGRTLVFATALAASFASTSQAEAGSRRHGRTIDWKRTINIETHRMTREMEFAQIQKVRILERELMTLEREYDYLMREIQNVIQKYENRIKEEKDSGRSDELKKERDGKLDELNRKDDDLRNRGLELENQLKLETKRLRTMQIAGGIGRAILNRRY